MVRINRKRVTGMVLGLGLTALLLFGAFYVAGEFNTAYADNQAENQSSAGEKVPLSLTLDEALQMAQEHNYALKVAEQAKKKAYIQAEQVDSISRKLENATITDSNTQLAKYTKEKIMDSAKVIADKAYEVSKEQVKLLVSQKYYAALQARDLISVNEAALERSQKQLDNANAAFNVGTIAKTDVLNAEVGLAQAKTNLVAAKNEYQLAIINLNREIGLDLNTALNLNASVSYQPMEEIVLDQVIDGAMKTRLDIAKGSTTVENARLQYQALLDYIPGTYEARLAKMEVNDAELSLEDTKNQVISDLTKAYLNIIAAQDAINFLTVGEEQARESLRLANMRYEVGMATSLEILDASASLADIEAKRIKALYNFSLAKLSFETAKLAPLTGM
ncbi:MAG: Outer membrane protein TolC precursor [Pelotomaculum sp. PtaB.Bin104]|nr:MAG: Outer membrane protein TolC precursor [Pelotomaculum sp. PtaB.Bin104]